MQFKAAAADHTFLWPAGQRFWFWTRFCSDPSRRFFQDQVCSNRSLLVMACAVLWGSLSVLPSDRVTLISWWLFPVHLSIPRMPLWSCTVLPDLQLGSGPWGHCLDWLYWEQLESHSEPCSRRNKNLGTAVPPSSTWRCCDQTLTRVTWQRTVRDWEKIFIVTRCWCANTCLVFQGWFKLSHEYFPFLSWTLFFNVTEDLWVLTYISYVDIFFFYKREQQGKKNDPTLQHVKNEEETLLLTVIKLIPGEIMWDSRSSSCSVPEFISYFEYVLK